MKIKTSETTKIQLDWLVAKLEGRDELGDVRIGNIYGPQWVGPGYASDWGWGGPLIEREGLEISVHIIHNGIITGWACEKDWPSTYQKGATGPTPLIAAMRCYVASEMGDEVEVPEELCQ